MRQITQIDTQRRRFVKQSVAIGGGLTLNNAATWIATQAEFLAIGRALWTAPDGAPAALRAFNRLLADAAEAAGS